MDWNKSFQWKYVKTFIRRVSVKNILYVYRSNIVDMDEMLINESRQIAESQIYIIPSTLDTNYYRGSSRAQQLPNPQAINWSPAA